MGGEFTVTHDGQITGSGEEEDLMILAGCDGGGIDWVNSEQQVALTGTTNTSGTTVTFEAGPEEFIDYHLGPGEGCGEARDPVERVRDAVRPWLHANSNVTAEIDADDHSDPGNAINTTPIELDGVEHEMSVLPADR